MQNKFYSGFKIFVATLFIVNTVNSFSQLPNILICGAPADSTWNNDVKAKLQSTGQFNSVSTFNILYDTPTLDQLEQYDAVLVYTDANCANCTLLGDNLADYIDGGGGVVAAVFATASVPLGGRFASYEVIIPAGQIQGSTETLGTVLEPQHPIMQGVIKFNGGTSSYRSTATTLATGGYRIADWSDGRFLITAKENVGVSKVRRVDLGFYPPSKDARSDFWITTTDGALILANSLTYVARNTSTTCLPPFNLNAHVISDTAVKLSWSAVSGSAHSLKIFYRVKGTDAISYERKSATETQIRLFGLLSNTTYEWGIRSICDTTKSITVRGPDFTTQSSSEMSQIKIFPNPVKNNIQISGSSLTGKTCLSIVDFYGNVQLSVTITAQSYNWNVSTLKPGNYIIKIETKSASSSRMFIKE